MNKEGNARIVAVCSSKRKGTRKAVIPSGVLEEKYGLVGDAHADSGWHRQVSLLAQESIDRMRKEGYDLHPGDYAENLTCEGINLPALPVGTRLRVGKDIILRVSQIGKECHTGCAVFKQVGKCIMPTEGIFAEVLKGGTVKADDEIRIIADGE